MKKFHFLSKNLLITLLVSFVLFSPLLLMANSDGDAIPPSTPLANGHIVNPLGDNSKTLDVLIRNVLNNALKVGIPLIALAIIYCGFLFVSARGNPEEITKAREALIYTLIGAAILLGSYALALLIRNTVTSLG